MTEQTNRLTGVDLDRLQSAVRSNAGMVSVCGPLAETAMGRTLASNVRTDSNQLYADSSHHVDSFTYPNTATSQLNVVMMRVHFDNVVPSHIVHDARPNVSINTGFVGTEFATRALQRGVMFLTVWITKRPVPSLHILNKVSAINVLTFPPDRRQNFVTSDSAAVARMAKARVRLNFVPRIRMFEILHDQV